MISLSNGIDYFEAAESLNFRHELEQTPPTNDVELFFSSIQRHELLLSRVPLKQKSRKHEECVIWSFYIQEN